ncbi:hypothetical protein CEXT_750741, partial [Caerostris extrusa]
MKNTPHGVKLDLMGNEDSNHWILVVTGCFHCLPISCFGSFSMSVALSDAQG